MSAADCLVVGMGVSGFSVARYWTERGRSVVAVDNRKTPPMQQAFAEQLPQVVCHKEFRNETVRHEDYRAIALSPGVSPTTVPAPPDKLTNDTAIFAAEWRRLAPPDVVLLAVTGTNGKSTAVRLTAHLCSLGGLPAESVGNIGEPLLDALLRWRRDGFPRVVVAELSSFQLEVAQAFFSHAAVVLNVGNDHLDRHGDVENYATIKGWIYRRTQCAVWNKDDRRGRPPAAEGDGERRQLSFSSAGHAADWQLLDDVVVGDGKRLPMAMMSAACRAQPGSVLAALALTESLGLSAETLTTALASFEGLPHRQQPVATIDGVRYVDDSKATNTDAALFGLAAAGGDVVWIAGGDGKGQDFSPLQAARQWVRYAVLLGRDAAAIKATLTAAAIPCEDAADMDAAVRLAHGRATAGMTVLLSPACSSLDMFADFRARGAAFAQAVRMLPTRRAN